MGAKSAGQNLNLSNRNPLTMLEIGGYLRPIDGGYLRPKKSAAICAPIGKKKKSPQYSWNRRFIFAPHFGGLFLLRFWRLFARHPPKKCESPQYSLNWRLFAPHRRRLFVAPSAKNWKIPQYSWNRRFICAHLAGALFLPHFRRLIFAPLLAAYFCATLYKLKFG